MQNTGPTSPRSHVSWAAPETMSTRAFGNMYSIATPKTMGHGLMQSACVSKMLCGNGELPRPPRMRTPLVVRCQRTYIRLTRTISSGAR
ncbi:MYB DNA-binding domain-containing protein [Histoplasma capsulatum var. duboisii H88]|uniref:MYB DNA-binding domain-containing protein n=1 Tax=Ajellomyces capsulatus (strain H88) TaxID=544711 RepID=A0A8A1LFN0_AJEC8|nr:MYB DNA-binding domain-containing protein [Histoplasma capsulatum var. duboisii H88]